MAKVLPGLDIHLVRTQPELVKSSLSARRLDEKLVDTALALDKAYRTALTALEELSRRRKEISKLLKGRPENFNVILAEAKELSDAHALMAEKVEIAHRELVSVTRLIPNLVHAESPVGGEDDYKILKKHGEKPNFTFEPKSHDELGEALALYDAERGAKVSGSRFVFLKGSGAILEKALLDYALHEALTAGFIPLSTPTLVRQEIMEGTGFTTQHNDEIYYLPTDELYLTGTSEVALAGYHADEILDLEKPIYYAGISTCYRREAGSAGKDTRGIIRLHQFTKLEAFVYAKLEDAEVQHSALLALQEKILKGLGLHYRVIDTATGDLGTSAYRKYDIEAWLPSQQRYLELTSSSNCLNYQAKQLNIRYKTDQGNVTAATLNGTLATTRWLVAILEQFQKEDGSVAIPEVLWPYSHNLRELKI